MVTDAEMKSGQVLAPPLPPPRVLKGDEAAERLARGFPYDRKAVAAAVFKTGDVVVTKAMSTPGHTRLPHYAWRKCGVISAWHGTHVFPDSNGMGHGEHPQHLYTVRFSSEEIWGKPSADSLYLDLWEPYLEPAA
jgi:nitrile hydratase